MCPPGGAPFDIEPREVLSQAIGIIGTLFRSRGTLFRSRERSRRDLLQWQPLGLTQFYADDALGSARARKVFALPAVD
jgi:hypothetical protein